MDRFSVNYKVLISVVSMLFFYYVQKHVMPYKSYEHNRIDLMSLTTATITIYAGIIFSLESEAYEGFKTFTWLIIVFSNVYFILSWVYLLMLSLGWKNPKFLWVISLLGCIIYRRRVDKNEIKQSSITEQIPAATILKEATPKRRVFGGKSAFKKIRKRKKNRKVLHRKKSRREPKTKQKKAPTNMIPILDNAFEEEKSSASCQSDNRLRFSLFKRFEGPLRGRIHYEES